MLLFIARVQLEERVRQMLDSAKDDPNEMFRVCAKFNALFVRPNIQVALHCLRPAQSLLTLMLPFPSKHPVHRTHSFCLHLSLVRAVCDSRISRAADRHRQEGHHGARAALHSIVRRIAYQENVAAERPASSMLASCSQLPVKYAFKTTCLIA